MQKTIDKIAAKRWVKGVRRLQPSGGVLVELHDGWTFLGLTRQKQFATAVEAYKQTHHRFVMQPEMVYVEAYYHKGWICARPYCSDKFERVTQCDSPALAKKIVKQTMGLECPERK